MSDSEKRTFSSYLKHFTASLGLLSLFLPAAALAEPQLMLHSERSQSPATASQEASRKSTISFGLTEHGDLAIRHSDVSLALAYNPPNDLIGQRERAAAQRQDNPLFNGITIKMTLLF